MSGLRKYLIFGAILLGLYFVAQYTKPKPINWDKTLLPEDKIPFGTYVLRQQIADVFPKSEQIVARGDVLSTLNTVPETSSTYIIIAPSVRLSAAELKAMKKYIQAGNNVLIAAFEMTDAVEDSLKVSLAGSFRFSKKKYPINFTSPYLKRELDYYFEKGISANYFTSIDTAKAVVLGRKYEEVPNLVQYRFGKGSLLLCANPQLFTNYSLLNENGADYAAKVLSYLPQSKALIWDEHFSRPVVNSESHFRVLFSYEQLRWAYYLALVGLIIFVLYEMKRRQRIIPIIDPLKNTSVEFAKVVGRVYYQQRNHNDIIDKKINYFLAYLRNKYRLKTTTLDEEFTTSLIKITNIDEALIRQIVAFINTFQKQDKKTKTNDNYLIQFNKLIEQFYKLDR
ncbi:DUF4350 domain-containing protein [Pedobacter sp.]